MNSFEKEKIYHVPSIRSQILNQVVSGIENHCQVNAQSNQVRLLSESQMSRVAHDARNRRYVRVVDLAPDSRTTPEKSSTQIFVTSIHSSLPSNPISVRRISNHVKVKRRRRSQGNSSGGVTSKSADAII